MEGATLTINFRDESTSTPQSPAATPQQGTGPPSNVTQAQQEAIAQAGGAGQSVEAKYAKTSTTAAQSISPPIAPTVATVPVSAAIPFPAVSTGVATSADEKLANLVKQMQGIDPKATAEEIAKALGAELKQIRSILGGTQPSPSPVAPSKPSGIVDPIEALIFPQDLRRTRDDKWIEEERQRFQNEQRSEQDRLREETERARFNIPRPPPLTREQILDQASLNAPPLPKPPPSPADTSGQVQSTINAISHFAHMGGPLGSAAAGAVNTAVAIPGVASAIGAAVPALVAAGPYIAAAAAVTAAPIAAYTVANRMTDVAIMQARGFSPDVAVAEAQADVRQMLANMRTARRLGDEAAQAVENRSRLAAARQGLMDFVREPVMKDFNDFNSAITKFTEVLNNLAQNNPQIASNLSGSIVDHFGAMLFGSAWAAYKGTGMLSRLMGWGKESKDPTGLMNLVPEKPALPYPFSGAHAPITGSTVYGQHIGMKEVREGL